MTHKPEILAPSGDRNAMLAALAAGADAVYLGLKNFSARMQAGNFSVKELVRLSELARRRDCKTFVAMNTLLKPGDIDAAGRLIDRLNRQVHPDALIVQDLGFVELARQTGFKGEVHLSTLANITHPAALRAAHEAGANRVIIPRELNLDEIRTIHDACPEDLDLELFVHGALCYCVSGRCYWSSYMGGKSGLRGRCVQPCRRVYKQRNRKERFFSCQDLSIDVLTKTLLDMPRLRSWKIEGRKKGPHYVFYTTTAYRMLRDNPNDAGTRKEAERILKHALGRASTHFYFLPQRKYSPLQPGQSTASGMVAGKTAQTPKGDYQFKPWFELKPGDLLRIGAEDEHGHQILKIRRAVPKGGTFGFKPEGRRGPKPGSPIYLIDRQEPELMNLLKEMEAEAAKVPAGRPPKASNFSAELPRPAGRAERARDLSLRRRLPQGRGGKGQGTTALWVSPASTQGMSRTVVPKIWWWMPPVIWPDEEEQYARTVSHLLRSGAKHFVLGSPWQTALFPEDAKVRLWAGPFCNVANPLAVAHLAKRGFEGVFVAPELHGEDILDLPGQSCLPMGIVQRGTWPLGISRIKPEAVKALEPLASPKNEIHYVKYYGQNAWLFPNWPLDITEHRQALEQAGYSLFVTIHESRPRTVPEAQRTSPFNWDIPLL